MYPCNILDWAIVLFDELSSHSVVQKRALARKEFVWLSSALSSCSEVHSGDQSMMLVEYGKTPARTASAIGCAGFREHLRDEHGAQDDRWTTLSSGFRPAPPPRLGRGQEARWSLRQVSWEAARGRLEAGFGHIDAT